MDQELLMKQIVEQVMQAMNNGGSVSAPAASAGGKITLCQRIWLIKSKRLLASLSLP